MKFKGLDNGQRQAVITKVCAAGRVASPNTEDEEILQRVLNGDLEIVVQKSEQILFDRNGRRIPSRELVAAVCDPNRGFCLQQPKLDYAHRLVRLNDAGLPVGILANEFEDRVSELLSAIGQNERSKNLLKGIHLPFVMPRMDINDLGEATEKLVETAAVSYRSQFPGRPFTNYRKGELVGQVTVVAGSRYQQMLDRLAQGSVVVGVYFPICLQGFSVHAQREQMNALPEEFVLSGPLEMAMAWAMYPDVLGRDWNTPGYDCSAVQWQSSDYSLNFRASDACAYFDYRTNPGRARAYCSGGLLIFR